MQPAAPPLLDIINTLALLSSAHTHTHAASLWFVLGEHETRALSPGGSLVGCVREVHSRASKSEAAPIGMAKIV